MLQDDKKRLAVLKAQQLVNERSAAQALRQINAQQAEFELMKKQWADTAEALSHRSQEEVKEEEEEDVVEVRRAVDEAQDEVRQIIDQEVQQERPVLDIGEMVAAQLQQEERMILIRRNLLPARDNP